jgi:GDP-L-fucose synthase
MFLKKDAVCLITGGSGLIGSHLIEELKKYKVKIFSMNSKMYDLTQFNEAKKMFQKYKPDIVYNLAAKVGGILDNKNFPADYYYENNMIISNIFQLCKDYRVKKLINIGAGCGYPLSLKEPLRERDMFEGIPQGESLAYSMTKKMIMVASQAYKKQYKLNSITIIPSNIYGEYDNFNLEASHVIPALVRKFFEAKKFNRKSIEIWGDGSAKRDFIHASDVVKSLVKLTNSYNDTNAVNVCCGKQFSIKYVVNSLVKISNYKGRIIWNTKMPSGQKSRKFSTTRFNKILPNKIKKFKGIKIGLEITYKWIEKNYEKKGIRL